MYNDTPFDILDWLIVNEPGRTAFQFDALFMYNPCKKTICGIPISKLRLATPDEIKRSSMIEGWENITNNEYKIC